MASLVADYGNSSGDSEEEEDSESVITPIIQERSDPSVNFFGDIDGGSSDDSGPDPENSSCDQEKSQDSVELVPKLPTPFLEANSKLPAPPLTSGENKIPSYTTEPTSSVFVNPFEQAEQVKLGILEQHVRLTEAAPTKPASKQICFKFRKGTCHLGAKCRFFHDRSNIVVMGGGDNSGKAAGLDIEQDSGLRFGRGDQGFLYQGHGVDTGRDLYHSAAQYGQGQPADLHELDGDSYLKTAKGKKRCGLSDTLVPPKKAMTELDELRKKERPWTTKK